MGFLSQPYPLVQQDQRKWKAIVLIGAFVFLFLLIFQPFGLAELKGNKIPVLLGYGLITSLVVWVFNYPIPKLFPGLFREKKHTLFKELLFSTAIVFFIAMVNWYYTVSLGFMHPSLQSFLIAMLWTFSLGVFPVAIGIMVNYQIQLKKNLEQARKIQSEYGQTKSKAEEKTIDQLVSICDLNGTEVLKIEQGEIIRLEAAGNYVELHYLDSEITEKILIRNSLKNIAEQLSSHTGLIQTHRSHFVNLHYIESVHGNAQGLLIKPTETNAIVPVSRNYIAPIKEAIK